MRYSLKSLPHLIGLMGLAIFLASCSMPSFLLPSKTTKDITFKDTKIRNGITQQQVQKILGKPDHIQTEEVFTILQYSHNTGLENVYVNESSFAQGIGYVLPLQYKAKELRIFIKDNIVQRVERILMPEIKEKNWEEEDLQ